jgi:hypothetical protein
MEMSMRILIVLALAAVAMACDKKIEEVRGPAQQPLAQVAQK